MNDRVCSCCGVPETASERLIASDREPPIYTLFRVILAMARSLPEPSRFSLDRDRPRIDVRGTPLQDDVNGFIVGVNATAVMLALYPCTKGAVKVKIRRILTKLEAFPNLLEPLGDLRDIGHQPPKAWLEGVTKRYAGRLKDLSKEKLQSLIRSQT